MSFALSQLFLALSCAADPGAISNDFDLIVLTADTEGHVGPCMECPHHPGLGGLSRRATLVTKLRKDNPSLLLADTGNAFIGKESLNSHGKVIVAVHNALDHDEVNVFCARDFWADKAETLALLKDAKSVVISANLRDAENGEPLARPYVVRKVNGQRIGVIDVAEAPAGWTDPFDLSRASDREVAENE